MVMDKQARQELLSGIEALADGDAGLREAIQHHAGSNDGDLADEVLRSWRFDGQTLEDHTHDFIEALILAGKKWDKHYMASLDKVEDTMDEAPTKQAMYKALLPVIAHKWGNDKLTKALAEMLVNSSTSFF